MERVKVLLNSRCGILYPNNSKADQTMIETIEMTETKLLVQLWYAMVTTRERTEAPIDDDYEPNCASHKSHLDSNSSPPQVAGTLACCTI